MNWRTKAILYRALSRMPGGDVLYRWAQRKVTHSLIPTDERIAGKVNVALGFWTWLKNAGLEERARSGGHFDFGAGWHPTIPLTFYALGVDSQVLVDLQAGMTVADVTGAISAFNRVAPSCAEAAGHALLRMPVIPSAPVDVRSALKTFGIEYDAPCFELPGPYKESATFVTSTQVLLHIPEKPMLECFRNLRSVLKPGGLFLATIHLQPLYGGLREGAERFEHLRYSPEQWETFGSRLMYYNRLKAPDYRRLLGEAGFEIREWKVTPGTVSDLEHLAAEKIDPCFKSYSRDDLAASHLFFAAEKR